MKFRKQYIKGFIVPGACNYYIAAANGNNIFGILGFKNPDYGNYDLLLKADTTISSFVNSIDLLLYVLRTKEVKKHLELKFNREISNCISKCFSRHSIISRYRKHAFLLRSKKVETGYDLTYLFKLGTVESLKAAKGLWLQRQK